jgi:glycosyltransferase involved in cell wall biosynthesis
MAKQTVLFLCAETFPPPYSFLENVFNRLLGERGFQTVWVMPSLEMNGIEEIEWAGSPVILIPKIRPESIIDLGRCYWQHLQWIKRAASLAVKQYGPFQMFQVRDDPAMAFVTWRLAIRFETPWVYQISHLKEEETMMYSRMRIYGSPLKNLIKGAVGLFLRNFLLRRCSLVFPISEQMKETLSRYRIRPEAMTPLPEGVDTTTDSERFDDEKQRIREKLELGSKKIVTYVGTMSRFRQLDFLLKAFKLVLGQHPDTQLLMVGDGRTSEDLEWLKREAERLALKKNVTMTGWVPKTKVPAYIRISHLGVSPIPINQVYVNSSPIKLLEYLALGIPAVASDIPEQRKVLEESGGGKCVPWNVAEFASAISSILNLTESERCAIGQHGRAWVQKNRDFCVLAEKVYEAYERMLSTWNDERKTDRPKREYWG